MLPCRFVFCFNSIKVQLKSGGLQKVALGFFCFNSIKVQLKSRAHSV